MEETRNPIIKGEPALCRFNLMLVFNCLARSLSGSKDVPPLFLVIILPWILKSIWIGRLHCLCSGKIQSLQKILTKLGMYAAHKACTKHDHLSPNSVHRRNIFR